MTDRDREATSGVGHAGPGAEWAPGNPWRGGVGAGARDWHGLFRLATVLLPAVVVFGVEYLRHEVLRDAVPEMWGNLMTGAIALGTSALILIPIYRRLESADEQLHTSEIEHAVSEERERVARELHDGISQALFFLGVKAAALEHALGASQIASARQTAAEITQTVRETSQRVREAIFDLRTSPEPGQSIGVWTGAYVRQFGDVHGLRSSVEVTGTEAVLPLAHALQTMAMIREGLHNVAKHARAQSVSVRLAWGRDSLTVLVADDGVGVAGATLAGPERARYGLAALREYAEGCGGNLSVTPRGGGGTELVLRLPYVGSGSG